MLGTGSGEPLAYWGGRAAEALGKPELATNIWGLPQSFTWENYTSAWEAARLGYALTNSLIVSLGTTALVLALGGLAGYALAHFRFRFAGRRAAGSPTMRRRT